MIRTPQARPPMPPPNGQVARATAEKTWTRSSGVIAGGKAILIYGSGGIGKTHSASMAPAPVFVDLEHGTDEIDVDRIRGVETWGDLRACVQSPAFDDAKTLVIDSGTAAEDLCRRHVIANCRTDKSAKVDSIEGFGWGKGYTLMFEEWRRMLVDLDAHRSAGRNIVLICHENISKMPTPPETISFVISPASTTAVMPRCSWLQRNGAMRYGSSITTSWPAKARPRAAAPARSTPPRRRPTLPRRAVSTVRPSSFRRATHQSGISFSPPRSFRRRLPNCNPDRRTT